MEEKLKAIMDADEKLLWKATPESFELMDSTNKSHIVRKIIVSAAVTVALVMAYILIMLNMGSEIMWVLVAIIVLVGLYSACCPYIYANQLKKKISYAITDKRIVLAIDEGKAVPYTQISIAAIRTDADGHSALLCGPDAVTMPPHKWRAATSAGVMTNVETNMCDALVMYAIPDPKRVEALLKPYLTLN